MKRDEEKSKDQLVTEIRELRSILENTEAYCEEQRRADPPIKMNRELERQIRERELAEKALIESEERYRLLTENSLTGIYIHEEGRFVFVNSRMAELLGSTRAELIGRNILEFVHPDDVHRVKLRPDSSSNADRGAQQFEFRLVSKTGATRWVEVLSTEVQYKGRRCYTGNVADITKRKEVETQLLDKIRTIDDLYEHVIQTGRAQAIADHTARVAHELRQPLTIIGGFARRLARECAPCQVHADGSPKETFPIVINEVRRLEQILSRLIDFTRHEGLTLHKVNPHELIRYVVRVNEAKAGEKNLRVELNLDNKVGEIVLDQVRFQQVVRDLIANAIEASPENEVINIETTMSTPGPKAREAGHLESEAYFQLKIQNRGTPIAASELERIFDPFYSTKSSATGLGLTLSRKIVGDHNGSISVKSDENGTVFTVWIPIRSALPQSKPRQDG